ncbi:MAG: hypothetical protein PHU94_04165 [Bacilli bacterium]|nr:hypothetical protein [Bacilli bacterium]MDD4733421.1 hypothetical protein [Bacilli bacterium]
MKFVKKHKYAFITASVFLVLFILAIFAMKSLLYPDDKKSIYGSRLDGIEDMEVSTKTINEIKSELKEEKFVLDVNYNLEGRRMNFIVSVELKTDLITAKTAGDIILENLTDEEKKYYDIQLYLKDNSEESVESLYPLIGYKHKTSVNFIW